MLAAHYKRVSAWLAHPLRASEVERVASILLSNYFLCRRSSSFLLQTPTMVHETREREPISVCCPQQSSRVPPFDFIYRWMLPIAMVPLVHLELEKPHEEEPTNVMLQASLSNQCLCRYSSSFHVTNT
jgi:hypothetical protein